MQRVFRSFIKNGKECKKVVFFWKEQVPNPARMTSLIFLFFSSFSPAKQFSLCVFSAKLFSFFTASLSQYILLFLLLCLHNFLLFILFFFSVETFPHRFCYFCYLQNNFILKREKSNLCILILQYYSLFWYCSITVYSDTAAYYSLFAIFHSFHFHLKAIDVFGLRLTTRGTT